MATTNGAKNAATPSTASLEARYPVNTSWEFVLQSQETVDGIIYCTDDLSQTVVLQRALSHTVLATEIRLIHAAHIVRATQQKTEDATEGIPLSAPLPKIQKKVLEEREKKALKMAEESLRHINEKTTPKGQIVFDKLLKACSEAVWKGESILVLGQVQVDPPYGPEHCKILQKNASGKKSLDDGSLERIQKIIAAISLS
ncbi:hypothetical protein FisN_6Hh411 [Fistulifera solaris]|uniref:AD domain-containing protein n=1 Tax=Fistulifera solaris TaxID=1519565 RepID=A0A1Z5KER6_FISSO|nr:hypothetical protein FisN_6Hh411 [Fistulifera solaris]|eukprot:GAX24820.1 hypothetical protein FisN_6Hh411 [Fistulifera solaris]